MMKRRSGFVTLVERTRVLAMTVAKTYLHQLFGQLEKYCSMTHHVTYQTLKFDIQ